jgi:hypothetical protein
MKVARSALPVTLAHWERAGVRETVMAAATYILWGGADAMAVRPAPCRSKPVPLGRTSWYTPNAMAPTQIGLLGKAGMRLAKII